MSLLVKDAVVRALGSSLLTVEVFSLKLNLVFSSTEAV
jgi:hypothetical protein